MRIALIGMSGIGKSHWARKLAEAGFACLDCDERIAAKLNADLGLPLSNVDEVGNWMGLPYEAGFADKEACYLNYETEVLREIVTQLQTNAAPASLVIDLTGSAVYLDPALLAQLRRYITVVYLAITPEVHDQMLARYAQNPRPVLWRGLFLPHPGESDAAALQRCYSHLIDYRVGLYQQFADVELDYRTHRLANLTAEEFVQAVRHKMPEARTSLTQTLECVS